LPGSKARKDLLESKKILRWRILGTVPLKRITVVDTINHVINLFSPPVHPHSRRPLYKEPRREKYCWNSDADRYLEAANDLLLFPTIQLAYTSTTPFIYV
jgi:hypothetical protein